MRVEIRIGNLAGAGALCEYARQRLLSSLSHELRQPEGLIVSLSTVRGPGPAATRCRMLARLTPSLQLAVQETDSCPHTAIDAASERLASVLGRALRPARVVAEGARERSAARATPRATPRPTPRSTRREARGGVTWGRFALQREAESA